MGQQVVHVEVRGKDGAALQSFYEDIFGWDLDKSNPGGYGMVRQESGVSGGIGASQDGSIGHVTFYVQVADVGAALEKAESLGGSRMMGPDEVPGVGIVIGLFSDPEGHVIGLMSPQAS